MNIKDKEKDQWRVTRITTERQDLTVATTTRSDTTYTDSEERGWYHWISCHAVHYYLLCNYYVMRQYIGRIPGFCANKVGYRQIYCLYHNLCPFGTAYGTDIISLWPIPRVWLWCDGTSVNFEL